MTKIDHNTGNYVPYTLFRIVCGFFNVPQGFCETGPPVYRPYPRRLESLIICSCYNDSTFSSVILRPWVLVRPETNSRPPAWQPDAQQLSHRSGLESNFYYLLTASDSKKEIGSQQSLRFVPRKYRSMLSGGILFRCRHKLTHAAMWVTKTNTEKIKFEYLNCLIHFKLQ